MEFVRLIFKRILQTIPLLIIVSLLSFFIIRLSPVDPLAELKLNPSISPETVEAEKQRLKEFDTNIKNTILNIQQNDHKNREKTIYQLNKWNI